MLEGEFRPAGAGAEWCDAEVLRLLRRRSLAKLRREVEPVEPAALGRFLLAWQHVSRPRRGPRGVDGLLTVVDQLAGYAAPASAWESLILPSRVADYEPALLDELTASGEVTWVGHASLPGSDGWVSLHLGDQAPLTLPLVEPAEPAELSDVHQAVLDALTPGGAWFFRQLQSATQIKDRELAETLWDLVWAGRVTNDTFAPLRALIGSGSGTHRTRRPTPRARPTRAGVRSAPPTTTGRWAILADVDPDPTRRAHATAERMIERYGVVTRGAVMSERTAGGFAAVYKVLSAFEESGRCRRGYFVEGLGAAQFGTAGAIDRLRTFTEVGDAGQTRGRHPGCDRPGQPVRCRAAVARARDLRRPPPGTQGRRARRPRRRRADSLRRARRPHAADLERGRRRAAAGRPVALRGRSARCARPDDGREGRRRADPRRRVDPAARGPRRRGVRLDSTRVEVACLRATPSGGRPGSSTAR